MLTVNQQILMMAVPSSQRNKAIQLRFQLLQQLALSQPKWQRNYHTKTSFPKGNRKQASVPPRVICNFQSTVFTNGYTITATEIKIKKILAKNISSKKNFKTLIADVNIAQ